MAPCQASAQTPLLDALREYIGLSGTKKRCDGGQCGACTVLVNGRRICRSHSRTRATRSAPSSR